MIRLGLQNPRKKRKKENLHAVPRTKLLGITTGFALGYLSKPRENGFENPAKMAAKIDFC